MYMKMTQVEKLPAVIMCELDDANMPPGYTEAALPAYGTEYRVRDIGPLGSKRRKPFEIILLDIGRPYSVGDVVSGTVYIRPVVRDIRFEQVSIDLMLAESVVTGEGFVERRLTRRFSLAQFTVCGRLLEEGVFRKGLEYQVPFSLTIPQTNPYNCSTTDDHHFQHSLLPPSVGPPYGTEYDIPRAEDLQNLALRLNYYVRGQIKHQKNIQATETFTPFRFIPCYSRASYWPLDGKDTYNAHREVRDGKFLKKRTLGTVNLTISHAPKVLVLGQTCRLNLSLSSDMPLSVKQVNYKLCSQTTIVRYRTKEIVAPSLPNSCTSQQVVFEHGFDVSSLPNDSDFEIPLLLPENNPHAVPSFSTCISSRRYNLVISAILTSAQVKTSVGVEFPVTLVNSIV